MKKTLFSKLIVRGVVLVSFLWGCHVQALGPGLASQAEQVSDEKQFRLLCREFAHEMLIPIEQWGALLYELEKGVQEFEPREKTVERLKEMKTLLMEMQVPLTQFRQTILSESYQRISANIKYIVYENYSNKIHILVGIMEIVPLKLKKSQEETEMNRILKEAISKLSSQYNDFYHHVFKLSRMEKLPVVQESEFMHYTDFAEQCSSATPQEMWERMRIAILTFDHGPATDPNNTSNRLNMSLSNLTDNLADMKFQQEIAEPVIAAYNNSADLLDELVLECKGIPTASDFNFALMAGWHAKLEEVLKIARNQREILQNYFREYQRFIEQTKGIDTTKADEKWVKVLSRAQELVAILEDREQLIHGTIDQKNLLNVEELIRRERLDKHGISLEITPFAEPIEIRGNRLSLINAIENIVLNAFRWAEKQWTEKRQPENARVKIETTLDKDFVTLAISDNGPGIPEEKRKKIFELGYTQREGGTGIGLAESFYVIRDHGGTLDLAIDPEPGYETTFILKIPLVQESTGVPSPESGMEVTQRFL
jgi:signal transduction histidine kinase